MQFKPSQYSAQSQTEQDDYGFTDLIKQGVTAVTGLIAPFLGKGTRNADEANAALTALATSGRDQARLGAEQGKQKTILIGVSAVAVIGLSSWFLVKSL